MSDQLQDKKIPILVANEGGRAGRADQPARGIARGGRRNRSARARSSRGGKRSGSGPGGRTREQLYNDAKKLGIEGRSMMSKKELQLAVAGAN